nr:hypothetical protein [uncultured Microbacterium sp.]
MIQQIRWNGVAIAWMRSAEGNDLLPAELEGMAPSQLARFRSLDAARGAVFLTGRALLRRLARQELGREVRIESVCARCGGDHGAPTAPGIALSVSHAEGLTAVAVSTGAVALGIDAEPVASARRVDDLAPLFPGERAPDLATWTRIEAAVKADGRGFAVEPHRVRVSANEDEPGGIPQWSAVLPGRETPLLVATPAGPRGYVLSVAVG